MRKERLIIYFTVFLDILGFGLVVPILPFYLETFGAHPTTITLLFSVFSLFAFLSSPFLGALSDRIGRRPVLLGSIISTCAGWLVFAGATSIPLLFLGRIIDGAGAGNMTVAQSYLIDISRDDKERTSNLGMIGAFVGIGFIVGPIAGGALSTISQSFPFWVAGIMAGVNALLVFFFLPESLPAANTRLPLEFNPFRPLHAAANDKRLRPYYLSWLMFGLAAVMMQSVFALYAHSAFGIHGFHVGVLFMISGVVIVLNQAVLLKKVWMKRFTNEQLVPMMTAFLAVGIFAAAAKNIWLFYAGLLLQSTGQAVLRVALTSIVAARADPLRKGEHMGVLSAIFSACMVAAPLVSGPLFEWMDTGPILASSAIMGAAVIVAIRFKQSAAAAQ